MAGAAVAAAIAAIGGLSTWRKQEIWRVDADLARRLVLSIEKCRSKIDELRYPMLSSEEMELSETELNRFPTADRLDLGAAKAYLERASKFQDERSVRDALMVEARVLWGDEVARQMSKIESLEKQLIDYVGLYTRMLTVENAGLRKAYEERISRSRDYLYDSLAEDDEFRRDYKAATDEVEQLMRQKLGRLS